MFFIHDFRFEGIIHYGPVVSSFNDTGHIFCVFVYKSCELMEICNSVFDNAFDVE
jgi:hypothetical protein